MSEEFINAVRSLDQSVVARAGSAPHDLAKRLDEVNATLDGEARELAVELISRQDNQFAGTYLLRRTGDDDANVATIAVGQLANIINRPAAADIVAAIPNRPDPFIRGELYLFLGRSTESGVLEALRRRAADESDADASLHLLAARVRLGGKSDRQEMIAKVASTAPDDALVMQDMIVYAGEPAVARGLLTWLDREDPVMRLGSDRQSSMARMCDVGIWTARMLGIALPFDTAFLRNFTADEIESTRKILSILPE